VVIYFYNFFILLAVISPDESKAQNLYEIWYSTAVCH